MSPQVFLLNQPFFKNGYKPIPLRFLAIFCSRGSITLSIEAILEKVRVLLKIFSISRTTPVTVRSIFTLDFIENR